MFNNIFRGIADAPNYMVIITDSSGRIEWVNQGFTRLTGYELPEVAGQTPGSLLQGPLTDPSIVAKIGQELRCGNAVSNIKLVNYTKAGVPYWVQMEITPILDNTKNISGFFAIQFEVSKFQEESASEALFFEIIERMNYCVIICDQQTSISYVNRKFTNLFGGNRASYKGQAIKNLYFSMGCPRDQIRKLSDVFDKRAHVEDLELVKFDIEGKKRFFEVEVFPRQNSLDGSNGYIIIEKDVTAEKLLAQSLRESEFRFRVLAETIPGMAYQWRVDPDGTQGYNWVSPRSIDIFGVDPADLILNWSLVGIHPEDSQRWQDTIQISIAEMSEWSFLGRYIPPDQRPRWIHCVSRPVRQLDGSIIFYGVGIDVSKQRDLEQRILQAAAEEARANAANKAKSDFLALISHELRTPLNAIRN